MECPQQRASQAPSMHSVASCHLTPHTWLVHLRLKLLPHTPQSMSMTHDRDKQRCRCKLARHDAELAAIVYTTGPKNSTLYQSPRRAAKLADTNNAIDKHREALCASLMWSCILDAHLPTVRFAGVLQRALSKEGLRAVIGTSALDTNTSQSIKTAGAGVMLPRPGHDGNLRTNGP
jgi:hypothetical protein